MNGTSIEQHGYAISEGVLTRATDALLPTDYMAVQCTLFEKSQARNWLVAPHQDLSIPVAACVDHPALAAWSVKAGVTYVQPPVELLARLYAVRLHLEDCGTDDGPLAVFPGSHQLGRIQEPVGAAARAWVDPVTCVVAQGACLVLRPLLLHASSKCTGASMRRVLHYLFGPPTLPYGLRWANDPQRVPRLLRHSATPPAPH